MLVFIAGCPRRRTRGLCPWASIGKGAWTSLPLVLDATSAPRDQRVIVGECQGGPDLARQHVVIRQGGCAVQGPPPTELMAPFPAMSSSTPSEGAGKAGRWPMQS